MTALYSTQPPTPGNCQKTNKVGASEVVAGGGEVVAGYLCLDRADCVSVAGPFISTELSHEI